MKRTKCEPPKRVSTLTNRRHHNRSIALARSVIKYWCCVVKTGLHIHDPLPRVGYVGLIFTLYGEFCHLAETLTRRDLEGLAHVALTGINLRLECLVTGSLSYRRTLLGFTLNTSEIYRPCHIAYHQLKETKEHLER